MSGKDFGIGFYLTTDVNQGRRFLKSAIGKAIKNRVKEVSKNVGYISMFEYRGAKSVKTFEFSDADKAWLHCVAAHRSKGLLVEELDTWAEYDIIAGKIANDNTNQVITAYIKGVYGPVGSDVADNTAIGLLMPENLTDQICLKTKKGLGTIEFFGSEKVEL